MYPHFGKFHKMPIMGPDFDKEAMLNKMQEEGIFTALFDVEVFGFLLYQAMGSNHFNSFYDIYFSRNDTCFIYD